jgi:plasmid stability protein
MADITIHGLDASALDRLQRRADANKRSLEEEIRHILTWGDEYIERVQTLAAGMKPLEMPKPLNDEADLEAVERRKAFREYLRKGHQEHERLMQELDEEDAELERPRKDGEK